MRGHHHPLKSGICTPEDDPDSVRPDPVALGPFVVGAVHKKAVGVRAWIVMDATGQAQLMETGKHSIMGRTGLPARDLRILDPLLSYPSTVLGREKAIVINLEHIKAIITAREVLLLNSRDPSVIPFVEELQRRFLRHRQANKAQEGNDDPNWTHLYDLVEPQCEAARPADSSSALLQSQVQNVAGKSDGKQDLQNRDGLKILPFEIVALEACLEAACSSLENEAKTLEQEAHPALDKLTSKVSTLNLERVRQIKSRLVAITGRVQKVRDELENLLDDDDDMDEIYLTEKLAEQQLEESSTSPRNGVDEIEDELLQPGTDGRMPAEISLEAGGSSNVYDVKIQNTELLDQLPVALSRASHRTHTSTTHSAMGKHLDVEELEMLLEAYFVQIDGTLNKLSTLREYVDDTEDYINIMLDDKQNHLLRMGVMLNTATLVLSAFSVVTGVLGMNIHIDLFDPKKAGMPEFLWTVGVGTIGTIFLYVVAIAWCKHKRLLE